MAAAWMALAQPLALAWDRAINLRADRFSLEHAHEPDGLAMKLVRENGLQPLDPPLFERLITCSHPPLKARLDQAMPVHIRKFLYDPDDHFSDADRSLVSVMRWDEVGKALDA